MSKIRIITMALVAVFCFSAVVASSALAATKKGEIVNSLGNAPSKNKFQGTSTTAGELETAEKSKIHCTGTTVTGTITSKTTGTAAFKFTGCTNASGNCATSGAAGKEIIVANIVLKGAALHEADLILNEVPEFSLHCGTELIDVLGSIWVPVEPEGKLIATTERAKFAVSGGEGKQKPEEDLSNHLRAKFGSKTWSNASLSASGLEVAFEETVEFV